MIYERNMECVFQMKRQHFGAQLQQRHFEKFTLYIRNFVLDEIRKS